MGLNSINGDFNGDGNWDCGDVDALTAAIPSMSTDLCFDMNADGAVSIGDLTDADGGWLSVSSANNAAATGGNPFFVGDANLDGTVDVFDFNAWNGNKFSSGPHGVAAISVPTARSMCPTSTPGMAISSAVQSAVTAVPEPSLLGLPWLVAALAASRRRIRST